MPNDAWCRVRETLAKRIGKNNYTSWIEPLQLTDLSDGIARFDVPTTFFGDWVSRNFSDHILSLMNAEGLPVGRAELGNRVSALLEHFFHDCENLCVIQFNALVNFALLDPRLDQPDHQQSILGAAFHRRLHIVAELGLE